MKKVISLSLAFSALVFSASAQEQREIKKDKKARTEHHDGMKANRGIGHSDLTEAQRVQMRANREEMKRKMDELKTQNLTEAQMQEKRRALMEDYKAKTASILTAEQKAQIAQRKAAGMERKKAGKDGKKIEGKSRKAKYENLKAELGLTDNQEDRLKAQREGLKAQKQAIKNDNSLSKEAKKAKLKDLKAQAKAGRKNILTADQLSKWEAMKKDRKGKHSGKARK